ncbi:MAG: DUF3857 domain-containing protein [Bacteroidota bacterium]
MKSKLFFAVLFASTSMYAQKPNYKFGKVSQQEVTQSQHSKEPDAEAAILYKSEKVFYTYNDGEGFQTIRDAHYRIKIYNKNGLDWGTFEVPLYTSGNGEERISNVKGYTFNMVEGKLEETKLKKEGIFKTSVNKYRNKAAIAMPEVKEGSVLELQYRITSDFAGNLDDFQFQYGIPVDKVEVNLEIPEYYVFKRYSRGFYPINLDQSRKNRVMTFSYREEDDPGRLNGGKRTSEIEFMENVYTVDANHIPSLKEEDYTDNIDNYRSAIKFELASTQFPGRPYKNYSLSWEDVAKSIYKSNNFGDQLQKTKWVAAIVDNIKNESSSSNAVLFNIYNHVKYNIAWNGYHGFFCENGIKKALEEKKGNVADINLTLVNMLRYAGFKANPVLVSTKKHGIPLFPTREGFDYFIAAVEMDGGLLYMDATDKMGAIGVLPRRALNWNGRLVREDGTSASVKLAPSKTSNKITFVNATIGEDGSVEGKLRTQLTQNYANDYRREHKDHTVEDIMDEMENNFVSMEIDALDLKNQKECSKPIVESCHFIKEAQAEEIAGKLYLKPAMFLGITENPFKLEERMYPVDFGFPKSNKLTINFKIPEGYSITAIPENLSIALPDSLGSFKYMVQQRGDQLQFSCSTTFKSAIIPQYHYASLKAFFDQIVVKQSENIVLSKV